VIVNLEDALALEPRHMTVLQQMISVKHELRRDFPQIKELCQRMVDMADRQTEAPANAFRQAYYNYMAMAEHQMEQYDSAMAHARLAIAQDTSVAYPYTTLAEVHGLTGNDEGFYRALETALAKGFKRPDLLAGQEPYRRYADQPRYRALLQQYAPKEKEAVLADNPE
jgi:hypothetical protein